MRSSSGRLLLLLGGLAIGCGGAPATSLGGPAWQKNKEDAGSGDPHALARYQPRSAVLGCGQGCVEAGVGSDGHCTEDGIAVRCADGVVICDECAPVGRECSVEGGARCAWPCEGEEVCPPGGSCYVAKCCPGARWCERGAQAICSENGAELVVQTCVEGLDCREGQCLPARPQVHVIFDTSGSMAWTPWNTDPPKSSWPACDDPESPKSRLGISKQVFFELFSDSSLDDVLFALQRFPQTLKVNRLPACPAGEYQTHDEITDHAALYDISDDAAGSWFLRNLVEVLVVGFPQSATMTNRDALKSWMDFGEQLTWTDEACSGHSDCPNGMCSGGLCRTFEDPELRAIGWTPLGQSLFYAAEYFRKRVVVDGMECALDRDCATATHFCVDGVCADPSRFCRQRSIVVFTDGADTASIGSWLDPVVQSKRLRAGLDCSSDGDCFQGFECDGKSGTCQPTGNPANPCASLGGFCDREERLFPKAADAGAERLRDRNGDPIRFTIHVVDVSGAVLSDSAAMAAYGGGQLIGADLSKADDLVKQVRGVIDWKDPDFCDEIN